MDSTKNTNWHNIKIGFQKYESIMERFHAVNISHDEDFQRTFNGFYRVRRRKSEFYQALYIFLESHKNKNVTFRKVLIYFFEKFGKLEASFSSKVVATINPSMPIWDSEVLKRLHLRAASYQLSPLERIEKTCEIYDTIIDWYSLFFKTTESTSMLATFDEEV
jgi:hypothetical protein